MSTPNFLFYIFYIFLTFAEAIALQTVLREGFKLYRKSLDFVKLYLLSSIKGRLAENSKGGYELIQESRSSGAVES